MIYLGIGIVILVGLMWYLDRKGLTKYKNIAVAGLLVGIGAYIGYSILVPPELTVELGIMEISGSYGIEVPLTQITDVQLTDTIPAVERRTNGVDAFGFALFGHFRLADWGKGRLFMQGMDGPYLVINYEDTFAVVSYRDELKTRDAYERLYEAWGK